MPAAVMLCDVSAQSSQKSIPRVAKGRICELVSFRSEISVGFPTIACCMPETTKHQAAPAQHHTTPVPAPYHPSCTSIVVLMTLRYISLSVGKTNNHFFYPNSGLGF